jgi:HK97 family phage major capsid protein
MPGERLADLRKKRAEVVKTIRGLKAEYLALVKREEGGEDLPAEDRTKLDELMDSIGAHDETLRDHEDRITRAENALQFESDNAEPVDDKDTDDARGNRPRTRAAARNKPDHESEPSLVIGGVARMMVAGGGTVWGARQASIDTLGERHPVTEALHGAGWSGPGMTGQRAMMASVGPSGGFIVPPDYVAELIEVLRPLTVVRDSGPRVVAMPRGTMQMPRQNQAASASYGGETTAIPVSQQAVGQIVASYKKLVAMTPVTNDLIRYSDPSVDAMVRDDLAQVIARREDLAFVRGDGTADSPKGFASFCLAGQKITSNAAYSLTTVAQEIGGALNKIETANVPLTNLAWLMHPRSKNYLLNVQNTNGFYVYRDEMTTTKTLLGWPFKTTTQIPVNLSVGGNNDCSEVYLVAMGQSLLFDSMSLELAVSREGTYTDANGALVSVFQSDQTLIRGIAEHDFHMRHDEAIAMITGVRWSPAIA